MRRFLHSPPTSHDPYAALQLLRAHAAAGDLHLACQLFDEIPHRNIFHWNSIIRAHASSHHHRAAILLFRSLRHDPNTRPDAHTFACLLRSCADQTDVETARIVHASIVSSGFESSPIANSALVSAFSKLGLYEVARSVFNGIRYPNLVVCNPMISGFGYAGIWWEGMELFRLVRNSEERIDGYTLVAVMSCFRDPELLPLCMGLHGLCLKGGFDSSNHVGSAIVSMYAKCDSLELAFLVFRNLSHPDLVTWSTLISGFARSGRCKDALLFFSEMHMLGRKLDSVLVATVLSACASLAAARPGGMIHCYAYKLGLDFDIQVSCALMDMYMKSGFAQFALRLFWQMPRKTVTAYNIVILGLGSHGRAQWAIKFFDEMLAQGVAPDKATFAALLCACCHSSLVKEAWNFFEAMQERFGIEPQIDHYVYMVRLLGMVGKLHDAYELIQNMHISPDSGVWGALLWGCNVHGNLELGNVVAQQLSVLEPRKTAYKVMFSNICAAEDKWDAVTSLRDGMLEEGAKKWPGHSWIGDV